MDSQRLHVGLTIRLVCVMDQSCALSRSLSVQNGPFVGTVHIVECAEWTLCGDGFGLCDGPFMGLGPIVQCVEWTLCEDG
jgi:hypothetical protein